MNKVKITVGITTYNLERYIAQALDSIIAQKTNFDFNVLVVDDASTDKTQNIIKSYAEKYPNKINYIFNIENKGSLYSSNKLFDNINSEYISFLDGDDYWLDENRLQKQIDFLDKHQDYTMVGGNTIYLKNEKLTNRIIAEKNINRSFSFDDKINGICPFVHTSSLVLRNVVYHNGVPFEYKKAENTIENPIYRGEDIRFMHHLEKGKLYIFPEDFSVYRIHSGGLWTSASVYKKKLESMLSNLKYMDLFPAGIKKWQKDFIALYRDVIKKILFEGFCMTEKEREMFFYILSCKNIQTINWNSQYKTITFKYKILLFLYKKLKKILSRKGYVI